MKLTVVSVEAEKPVGDKGAIKLQFKAKGEDDKILTYFTFSKRLFTSITDGKEIDATIETSEREHEGNTYVDRKVTEIEGAAKGGWQGGGRQESPEARASIETQVAIKAVTELLCSDKKVPKDIRDAYDAWLRVKLSVASKPETGPEKATEKPPEDTTAPMATPHDAALIMAAAMKAWGLEKEAAKAQLQTHTLNKYLTPKISALTKAQANELLKSLEEWEISPEDIPF